MATENAGCETPILEISGSKPIHSKVFPFRSLFISFHIHVLAGFCEAQLHLCEGFEKDADIVPIDLAEH